MIIYFTGTGNSRYCAQLLAQLLEDEAVDAFDWLRSGASPRLTSARPWVFVSPTYGWQLPRLFAELLRRADFSGCRNAYFVMTCGSEIGNASPANRALCGEMGLTCRGTLEVIMPENYIALFKVPQPQQARAILRRARPVLEQGAACIRAGQDLPPRPAGLADRLKSGPVNSLFYRLIIRDGPFTVSDACVGCGKCAGTCPMGNITLTEGRPRWGGHCTHCMACICGCPAAAIEYGRSSRGKPRYQCPDYHP